MHLQAEDKSNKALTVGTLNVLGGMKSDELTSIHTHLQTQDGIQSRIIADMEKLYQNISADGVISANEKLMLKKELTIIETEYPIILAKAETAKKPRADIDAYKESYRFLIDYLYNDIRVFDNMNEPVTIERDTFNKRFAAYYKRRAVLQIAQDGKPADLSFPSDEGVIVHTCFDEAAQQRPHITPSYTAWQSKMIEYDCTGKQSINMTFAEALNNVIILSGELHNDFTLHLFFDNRSGNGAKQYQIVYKLTGNYTVTLTTDEEHTNKIVENIDKNSFGSGCYAIVDFKGNVWRFKGSGGGFQSIDIAGIIEDHDYFIIEKEKEIRKIEKPKTLEAIQQFDSPIGEIKTFFENDYKHGFLEANGLPFSPDVFPEFAEYVKRVWNTGTDAFLGWPLRPKLEKPDYPIGEVLIAYDKEYKHGFLEANGLPFSPDVFPEFAEYVKRVWNTDTDAFLGWPLRPVLIKNDGSFVFIRASQTARNDGSHYFIKAIQGV